MADTTGRRRDRWLRRLRNLALGASVLALLCGAGVAGWWGRDRFGNNETIVTVQRPITVVQQHGQIADAMPNVLGLDRDSARQALADAGIDLKKVSIREQAYAGDPGVVIDQNPPAAASLPATATLTLSAPGIVPRLRGLTLNAARSELSRMGASVTVLSRYQAGVPEGSVLETRPAQGEPLTDRVRVMIAEPASSVFLDQLGAINSACGTDAVYVAGQKRQHSLVCEPSEGSPSQMEYVLNRRVSGFQAVIGAGDTGASDTPISFRVFVDGRLAFSAALRFGSTRAISIPVAGALRVRLEVGVAKQGPSGSQAIGVFGSARFTGASSAIDQLTAESHP